MVLELEPPISLESQRRILRLAQRIALHPDVRESIPGMNNLTVLLTQPQHTALDAIERLQRWWEENKSALPEARQITIPFIYGAAAGPDLARVAEHTGMKPRQVVECPAGANYVVYFLDFQSRFPYLDGLPEALATPRRAEPRLQMPAGSVGPGGWQLIGHTAMALFTPRRYRRCCCVQAITCGFVPQVRRGYAECDTCRYDDRGTERRPQPGYQPGRGAGRVDD